MVRKSRKNEDDTPEVTREQLEEEAEGKPEIEVLETRQHLIAPDLDFIGDFLPWQVQALIPLARGDSALKVAERLGKGVKAVYRIMDDPGYRKALEATTSYLYTYGLRNCAIATVEATDYLRQVLRNDDAKTTDRLKAAQIIIDQGDRWQNQRLEVKLAELEKQLRARLEDEANQEDEEE